MMHSIEFDGANVMQARATVVVAAAVLVGVIVAGPAFAGRAALDQAIEDAVKDYRNGGAQKLEESSRVCYPARKKFVDNGAQVDYCVAYDIAANKILQVEGEHLPDYFEGLPMSVRQTGEAEAAGLFVGPDGLVSYMRSRIEYVQPRVKKRL
jgi:hypothetical protein